MREKTIADKMYLKSVKALAVINGGVHPTLVEQLPAHLLDESEDEVDVVLVLALNQAQLEQFLPSALARLGDKASLWIGFLKQSAPKATDLTRDLVEAYAGGFGVTGVALASLDSDWSAIRFKRL